MAPSAFIDFATLRDAPVTADAAAIEAVNPHRGAMRLLTAVTHTDPERPSLLGAYYDVPTDAFWVPGHIPGRPIFPGVLMLEAAAQLCSYSCITHFTDIEFMGFAGADAIKFRGQVSPGDRLFLALSQVELKKRRSICDVQGFVSGNLVFECRIKGMPL